MVRRRQAESGKAVNRPRPRPKSKRARPDAPAGTARRVRTTSIAKSPAVFPIVAVGASAGGIETGQELFSRVPADANLAFVFIMHLDPTRESLVDKVIGAHTPLRVVSATDGMRLEPGRLHVAPPGQLLDLHRGVLKLSRFQPSLPDRLPIDHFLKSLAADQGERAVAIILSGSGTDGASGARAIAAAGGVVMVQEAATARFDGMPQSAIATGVADFVLPVPAIPAVLVRLSRAGHAAIRGRIGAEAARLSALLALLRARLGFNFGAYKKATLLRRLRRRMALRHIPSLARYIAVVREDGEEVRALARDFLIGVTEFFREPEAWEALEKHVIRPLVRRAGPGRPIRTWVAGCATGEEAYTVAMLFLEHIRESGRAIDLQIFASDVSEGALATARVGRYPKSIASRVSPARLRRFFTPSEGDGWVVCKELREVVVFATQNLVADPPYSRMDLVCCRNLLIYLEPEVQQRALSVFHFALGSEGCLFLGPAESLGPNASDFRPLSKKWRIFRRDQGKSSMSVLEALPAVLPSAPLAARVQDHRTSQSKLASLAQQILLDRFAPAAVLVNGRNEAVYLSGPTDLYLRHPRGAPTHDLLQLVREGLSSKLREGLASATARSGPVEIENLQVKRGKSFAPIQITVLPLAASGVDDARLRLVVFQEDRRPPGRRPRRRPASEERIIGQLESELMIARGDLKASIEQLESSNEEMRASNEEVMSINEELQSSNEELETSREELQSLNEELGTVNSQLQAKVGELEQTNNDLANLLASTEIATLCLDREHRINWFTPPTTDLLHLKSGDRGRSIGDFTTRFHGGDLVEDVETVNRTLVPLERTVRAVDGRTFIERVLPYRTGGDRIEGVVVTFIDVTSLQNAERALQILNENLEQRVEGRTHHLRTLQRIAKIANQSRNVEELVAETLTLVSRQVVPGGAGWVLAHVLLADTSDPGAFVDSGIWWRAGSVNSRDFERAVRDGRSRAGPDPIGRAIATRERVWLPDLSTADGSPWIAARAAGLRSALLVPASARDRTVGVLMLFSDQLLEPEEWMFEVTVEIGSLLGLAVERAQFHHQVVSSADEERRRIAQHLHDGIGQRLAAIGMLATNLRREMAARGLLEAPVAEIARNVEETRGELRTLVRGLLPEELDAGGLMVALDELAEQYSRSPGLDCRFVCDAPVGIDDNLTATQLFWIAQEATRNAFEHAKARHVTITLEGRECVVLTVRDDGKGVGHNAKAGSGIQIMTYRAGLIGGRLHIASAEGEGTIVTCELNRQTFKHREAESLLLQSGAATPPEVKR